MARVLVPLADGFEEIEAITIIDILRRGDIEVCVASLGTLDVKGAHAITVRADVLFDDRGNEPFEMIVLPGGYGGTMALANDHRVQGLLKAMDDQGLWIGAICAAPIALDKAGVLKEGFTCYPSCEEAIDTIGYDPTRQVMLTQNILTSRGPATAFSFSLEIIRLLQGASKADDVASQILY